MKVKKSLFFFFFFWSQTGRKTSCWRVGILLDRKISPFKCVLCVFCYRRKWLKVEDESFFVVVVLNNFHNVRIV